MWKTLTAIAMLAASVTAPAQASSTVTVQMNATVREVQCTPEQRIRIRACAPSSQSTSLAPFKTASLQQSAGDQSPAGYQINVDPTRQVLVRTILY